MITPEQMQAVITKAEIKLQQGMDNMDLIEQIQKQLSADQSRYIERFWGGMDEHSVWLDAVKEIADPGRWKRLHGRK